MTAIRFSLLEAFSGHHRARLIWIGFVAAAGLIVWAAAAPPFVDVGVGAVLRLAFSSLCHQQVDRAFDVNGTSFAVCHRCFGIYAGALLGLLSPFASLGSGRVIRRHLPAALCTALMLIAVDWGLDVAGLWTNTLATRSGTGLLLGLICGHYLRLAVLPYIEPNEFSPNPEKP